MRSSYYFDLKRATLDYDCLPLIADAVLEEIGLFQPLPTAIGGLTMGADFIVAAVVTSANLKSGQCISGSIVRKEPKAHGTMSHIENELPRGTNIVVVDDVITTGRSIREACEVFVSAGYNIVGIVALVDREEGGREALERDFAPVRTLYTRADFPIGEAAHA